MMKKGTVAQDNVMFFVATVGMSLGMEYFAQAVLESSLEIAQFPTDNVGSPGYIRIDSSAIRKKGNRFWSKFADKIRNNNFLFSVSCGFSSRTKFEGDLAEQVALGKDGYVFSFHIKEYERDADHGFEIIKPEDLENIPEEEQLGRVVHLKIELAEDK